jgi:hypothetical protein
MEGAHDFAGNWLEICSLLGLPEVLRQQAGLVALLQSLAPCEASPASPLFPCQIADKGVQSMLSTRLKCHVPLEVTLCVLPGSRAYCR